MSSWILIVDDDVMNLKMARNILREKDMQVSVVRSGTEFLSFMEKNNPDLVLLDIMMPEMDGFEAFRRLRDYEKRNGRLETPVIFLTAENDSTKEKEGLVLGASDFIHKPFNPDVLSQRIEHIISSARALSDLTKEATIDKLTGFLNKASVTSKISEMCVTEEGALMIIDLDSFKLVNDIYGHDMGDEVLRCFSSIVKSQMNPSDIPGRIGGDEFVAFCCGADEERIASLVRYINKELFAEAKKLMGEDFNIPIGASIGAVFVPEQGNDYENLFKYADKALYMVKQNGKHDYAVYGHSSEAEEAHTKSLAEMDRLTKIFEERNEASSALMLGQEAFINIYRFLIRFLKTYNGVAFKVLFTLYPTDQNNNKINEAYEAFGENLKNTLRKSDLMMQVKVNQFFLLLPELLEDYVDNVISRIMDNWASDSHHDDISVQYELEFVDGRVKQDEDLGHENRRRA